MKRILSLITVFALLFVACEGDQGPQGPPGFDGLDADEFAARGFEIENVNFTQANNFSVEEAFGFDVPGSAVTLVYVLWETLDDGTDVWRPLPQTVIFNDGNDLVYNFDATENDVRFFLEGSDLLNADPTFTLNQVFRVAVLPVLSASSIDLSDINAVMEAGNIQHFETF